MYLMVQTFKIPNINTMYQNKNKVHHKLKKRLEQQVIMRKQNILDLGKNNNLWVEQFILSKEEGF